jgi:hypothetical protein
MIYDRVARDLVTSPWKEQAVPTAPLKAHQTRADGTPVLRIEVPHSFDHDQAARALAIVYAQEPLRKSIHALRDGLLRAVELRVLDEPRWVSAEAVDAYRARLRKLNVFPPATERQRMLKRLRTAQRKHRATDPASRPTAPLVRQPAIWAKHTRESDGAPVVIIEQPLYFDHGEAAGALAILYRAKAEPLRSINALRLGLQEAGRERLLDDLSAADDDLADEYRSILVEQGVFALRRVR